MFLLNSFSVLCAPKCPTVSLWVSWSICLISCSVYSVGGCLQKLTSISGFLVAKNCIISCNCTFPSAVIFGSLIPMFSFALFLLVSKIRSILWNQVCSLCPKSSSENCSYSTFLSSGGIRRMCCRSIIRVPWRVWVPLFRGLGVVARVHRLLRFLALFIFYLVVVFLEP